MASLQRHLQQQSLDDRERQFYQSSLHHISILSGSHVELKGWMVTSYDVDFGSLIGSGGLWVCGLWSLPCWSPYSGQVFEGVWNKTPVALKVLKADGVAPSSMVRPLENKSSLYFSFLFRWAGYSSWNRCEQQLSFTFNRNQDNCYRLGQILGIPTFFVSLLFDDITVKSTHCIIEFLGANVLDERPFIVMPYLKNGNARTYLEEHPNCDRLLIVGEPSACVIHMISNIHE